MPSIETTINQACVKYGEQRMIKTFTIKELNEQQVMIIDLVSKVCERYDERYWRRLAEENLYPDDFVNEISKLGLSSIPIPKEYGGPSLGLREASLVLEEINAGGGNAQPFHGQYYMLFMLSRFASDELKKEYLPKIADSKLRLQSFALTEPESGSDTTKIKTFARKSNDKYIINGHKIFISRVLQSDLMLLVARTKEYDPREKKDGITIFLVDLKKAINKRQIEVRKINTVMNSQTYELFISDLEVSEGNVVGEVDKGFYYLLHVLNPERVLIASECIGDARWFISKSVEYAKQRVVFDKPIGANQGIQFPIASVYAKMLAASSITWTAANYYDKHVNDKFDSKIMGSYANIAKYLASECSFEAANVAMDVYGGYGMVKETEIARKMLENRLYRIAPVSQNLVLSYIAHDVLELPRSY